MRSYFTTLEPSYVMSQSNTPLARLGLVLVLNKNIFVYSYPYNSTVKLPDVTYPPTKNVNNVTTVTTHN